MALQSLTRSLLSKPKTLTLLLLSRPFSSSAATTTASISRSPFSLLRPHPAAIPVVGFHRSLSTSEATPSLRDPNLSLANDPSKEMVLLDGCDFEHWLVVMEKPQGDLSRDEIIDSYIKTLAQVFESEEEARMKIYAVSTRCYYAFGCLVSEEVSLKIRDLPGVRWVLPDSYLDVKKKTYPGEPFINGKAVPYDPKYHAEWTYNNSRANRHNNNEKPRSVDRSRNSERSGNTQNRNRER